MILLALGLLMPAFYYLPKAVLAAVVISSVMFLVEYEEIKPMWKSRSTLSNNEMNLFILYYFCVLGDCGAPVGPSTAFDVKHFQFSFQTVTQC